MATSSTLAIDLLGLKLKNPLLPAAGPPSRDANALIACAVNGAGGLVCKTVSTTAAPVPRTCMARPTPSLKDSMLNVELWSDLPPEAWINGEYQKTRAGAGGIPIVASVGYSAADMKILIPQIDPLVDAFEFSCHYTNLKDIRDLATALRENTKKPIFAKLSPHGHDLVELAKELRSAGVDGFVVMNSLGPCLSLDVEKEKPYLGGPGGKGWLSGPAIHPIAVYWVSQLVQAMPDVPVIGVGGVATWRDAAEFILAGASAVQVCTSAIYDGPKVFAEIAKGLEDWVARRGVKNISELRGRALPNLPKEANLIPPVSCADPALCIHCGICQKTCPYEAIAVDKTAKKWTVQTDKCYGCGLCSTCCPKNCITMVTRP